MRKPNLFIVGAPKSGTTSLRAWLNQHPDIWMELAMEPNFFASDVKIGSKFSKDEKAYLSLFKNAGSEKYVGDKSPLCLYSKQAAGKIKEFNPNAKIIIMLRNPAEMVHSLHNHFVWDGEEKLQDFEEAVNLHPFYKEIGCYYQQVKRYIDVFGKEAVHIVIFDDLKLKPEETYRTVLAFLDLPYHQPDFYIYNQAKTIKNKFLTKTISKMKNSPWRNLIRNLIPAGARTQIRRFAAQEITDHSKKKNLTENLRKHLSAYFVPDLKKLGLLINRDFEKLGWYGRI